MISWISQGGIRSFFPGWVIFCRFISVNYICIDMHMLFDFITSLEPFSLFFLFDSLYVYVCMFWSEMVFMGSFWGGGGV